MKEFRKKTHRTADGIAETPGKDERKTTSTITNAATKRCAHAHWRKKWKAPTGANFINYQVKRASIQQASSTRAGACSQDAASNIRETGHHVRTTYRISICVWLLSIRAQHFGGAAGTGQLHVCGSAPNSAWGVEDVVNSSLHMCRQLLLLRIPCPQGGLACGACELGHWLTPRGTHNPRSSPHSPTVNPRWHSMARPAFASIYAVAAAAATASQIPSRNRRRLHPPMSTGGLQVCDSVCHIRNPKPYADTLVCGNAGRRTHRKRIGAHEPQSRTRQWRQFLPGESNRLPPKGQTNGDTAMRSSGAHHNAVGGIHSDTHVDTRKASSTHARRTIQIAESMNKNPSPYFGEGGRTHIHPQPQKKMLPPTHRCAPTRTQKRASDPQCRHKKHFTLTRTAALGAECQEQPWHVAPSRFTTVWQRGRSETVGACESTEERG